MKNNYNKFISIVALVLLATTSHALQYKKDYYIWTYYNVADTAPLDFGVKALSRQDTEQFWNTNEPNDSDGEHCAVQQRNAGWNDVKCNSSNNRAACFNGTEWAVSAADANRNNATSTSYGTATTACNTVVGGGSGFKFAAPINKQQKDALNAKMVAANVSTVWINAFDNAAGMGKEGVWVLNRGVMNLFGLNNAWASSAEPSTDASKQCLTIDVDGKVRAESCAQQYPVVCATQTWNDVKAVGNTANVGYGDLHHLCQTEGKEPNGGESNLWWNFAAPRNSTEVTHIKNLLGQNNISKAWINATGNNTDSTWQFNLGLTNWGDGEPNFGSNYEKQCVVARQSDGKWEMAKCDDRAYILCSDGASWEARKHTHQFSNQAYEACSRPNVAGTAANPYLNHQLKTPVTEADHQKAAVTLQAMGAGNKAWLNMKYMRDTQKWYVNESYSSLEFAAGNAKIQVWYNVFKDKSNKDTVSPVIDYYGNGSVGMTLAEALSHNQGIPTYFADKQPDGSGGSNTTSRKSCIQLAAKEFDWAKKGQWDDTSCTEVKYVACSDGFEWRTSLTPTALGADADATENISAGHAVCAEIEKNGVKGNFRFAAPASFAESQNLLNVAASEGRETVWINMHSKKYWRAFVINQGATFQAPFWNSGEPNNAGSGENCAVQQRTAGWNDISCGASYPIACYDPFDGVNGKWQVTTSSHSYIDLNNAERSIEDFNLKCQSAFGGRYKFYAPITLSHQTDLKQAMGSHNNVHINANDILVEDSWSLNTHINNWASGQPTLNSNESCVSANAITSWWQSRSCNEELPVACSSGARWYFTDAKVKLSEFANGERACYSEFGSGYSFAAPRTLDSALLLQHFAKLEGLGGDFWINGNRLENFERWTWNANHLSTPVWGYGNQPDGGTIENCAVINNNDEGSWDDERCGGQPYAYLCRNGDQWQVTANKGLLADFSEAVTQCAALGAGWVFAAPTTYNENLAAKNAMGGNAKVWVNATDAVSEGTWLLNAAPINEYPLWGNTDSGSCLYQDDQGRVSSISCTGAQEYSWACSNGYTWKVTKSEGRIQKFADGHKACFQEYGADYMFSAPLSMNDSIQLDFARLQASSDRYNLVSKVWINMTTAAVSPLIATSGREFRRNLPFSNWRDFNAGEEPLPTLCAYKNTSAEGTNNPWRTASCSGFAAHYACTDGDTWRVALAKGRLIGEQVQLAPQIGEDYWSYERGNAMCKEQYGTSFYFSAPISASEELALDAAIRRSPANVKNVWLNYFAVSAVAGAFLNEYATGEIQRGDGLWFANRVKLGTWQKPKFYNQNNSDCALLHKDGSYTDANCSNNSRLDGNSTTYAFACFNGVEWSVTGDGYWEDGFAACENNHNSMYAVPRTPDELEQVIDKMSGKAAVWINLNDTAQEGQWIANRLRYSWWADGEPRNDFNKDCAKINASTGEWYAARCVLEVAPFACRTTTSGTAGSTIRWDITNSEGEWSEGFGACAKEYPNSEFIAPQGFGTISGSEDQEALAGVADTVINGKKRDAWINLSDQEFEGAWRGYHAYSNWGTDSLFDQDKDCAYIDTAVQVKPGKGNWFADSCRYTNDTAITRGYSCTNGSFWKIAGANPSVEQRWSSGFEACAALGDGWYFAAPTNDTQNRQLGNAMQLADIDQLWINAHDRINEGSWQINGLETNFPPEIDVSATAITVDDRSSNIILHAVIRDEEEAGINAQASTWTLVSNRGAFAQETDLDKADISVSDIQIAHNTHGAGSATLTAKYSTPELFKEDRLLTFKVTAVDNGAGTREAAKSEVFVNVRVQAPLIAAYDFESGTRPNRDITGHGHDILANTMASAQVVGEVTNGQENRALKLAADSLLVVPGLNFSATEYTLALRMSIESANNGKWRGIVQKGDGGSDRQPALFLFNNSDQLHSTNSTTGGNNRAANSADPLLDKQWLNVIYVKTANNFKVYVDGVATTNYDFVGGETSLNNTGSFYIGNIPGAEESMVGLIDDIHIFNREIPTSKFGEILPPLPMGSVGFVESSAVVNEFDANNANHSYSVEIERTRGSAEAMTVYVAHKSGSATRGTLADMANATHAADFAFTSEADFDANKGIKVSWGAGERGSKTVALTLDNADDDIREGTETAVFGFGQVGEPADMRVGLTGNTNFTLYINDLTPNRYGNIAVGIKQGGTLVSQLGVHETDATARQICFKRDIGTYQGTAQGDVTIHYAVEGTAIDKALDGIDYHYEMQGASFPMGATGGEITFADAESGEKCFSIIPHANPEPSDHNLQVKINYITSSVPETVNGVILSDGMQLANLIIQDFTPGVFGFDAASYRCFEEISETDNEKVPTWAQRPTGSVCEVVVKRTGTGTNAPEANLQLVVGANNYSLPSSTLHWDAVSSVNPATTNSETKIIQFVIAHNDVQNGDEQVTLSLTPVAGEVLATGSEAAVLYIQDVTTPAVITMSNPGAVNEGAQATFTAVRTGNLNTYFDMSYEVEVRSSTGNHLPNPVDYYIDTLGQPISGVTQWAVGEESKTYSFVAKNTDANIKVLLNLGTTGRPVTDLRPSDFTLRDDVVGLGDISAAGKGDENKASAELPVNNTLDTIESNMTVIVRDLGADGSPAARPEQSFGPSSGSIVNAGNFLAVTKQQIPTTRELELEIQLPADKQIGSATYAWTLLNPDGSVAKWDDGVTSISNTNGNSRFVAANGNYRDRTGNLGYSSALALSVKTKVKLPFVVGGLNVTNADAEKGVTIENTPFKLRLEIVGNAESFIKDIDLAVQPLYRRLNSVANDGKCLRAMAASGQGAPSCGGVGDWADLYWAWNPENTQLVNQKAVATNNAKKCFDSGSPAAVSVSTYWSTCSASTVFPLNTSGNTNLQPRPNGDRICKYTGDNITRRSGNTCSGSDEYWKWLD